MFVLLKVSQLILLNEAAQREGVPLPDLVPSAQQIRQAIESLVLAGQKLVTETPDDVCIIMYIVQQLQQTTTATLLNSTELH